MDGKQESGEVSHTALAVQSLCDGEDETVRRDGGAVSPPRRCRQPVVGVSSHSWACGAGSRGKDVVVFVFAVAVYHHPHRHLRPPRSRPCLRVGNMYFLFCFIFFVFRLLECSCNCCIFVFGKDYTVGAK